MARRLEPGWNFSTLYLIKDSLAIMLEAAGLLEDAFREYFELEACYLEALKQGGNLAGRPFGGYLCMHACAPVIYAWFCVCSRCCGPLCAGLSMHGPVWFQHHVAWLFTACETQASGKLSALFSHMVQEYTAITSTN